MVEERAEAARVNKPVLIVGAGVAGGVVAEILTKRQNSDYKPVGFVDDDISKQRQSIHGLPVLGCRKDIPTLVNRYNISEIIIAIPSAAGRVISQIVEISQTSKARLKILPGFYDFITGRIGIGHIRDIEMNDLLLREPVSLDIGKIAQYLTGQNVLITGAGGSIGSELCLQVAKFSPGELILLGRGENSIYEIESKLKEKFPGLCFKTEIADIKDSVRMKKIFDKYRPKVAYHAAAHKHVRFMEKFPGEAVKNNIIGTQIVAEAAYLAGTDIFVMLSTDKAVNPTSIMGATKRVAEMVIQGMNARGGTRYVAVRFGNVLGSRGSVIPLFKRQIARGGPLTITHPDMVRYFMTTLEAAQLVIQAGVMAKGGEIFVLDMGQPVKILDLAKKLIRLSGYEPEKDIKLLFTGISPGEKLVEQLLAENEKPIPTSHQRIFAVSGCKQDSAKVDAFMNTITNPEFSFQEEKVIDLLQEVLPGFRKASSFLGMVSAE
ncbi:UDP-N-acetyl-alpha-D-glucosamine C6 dehydratase [Pelotomaculum schinkii]|uniref:UDP-N-acetyl-alpha-D-glucosamine C6 dehydratase n=1 Tax=Pelotomaculum schinkii TaxID=78350 RepID=A0A4Y7RCW3_9FIRM|nr:nucleoside-diphosphate sugar epimerase/dehydratase [Pelotomaculum schinkii]TEB06581.1 UDP-N-acetyl-alpha-D-glucosamine C6 dehydratase [Pelotomaculum schinkii]